VGLLAALLALALPAGLWATDQTPEVTFPQGTATPSEECGACHQAIYREYAFGFGADRQYHDIVLKTAGDKRLNLPAKVSGSATPHSFAGVDPFPIHARDFESGGKSCNVCHYPEAFDLPPLDSADIAKPTPRPRNQEMAGLTCASCHLTPQGKIRGPYQSNAPHATVAEPKMQTSAACGYCHAQGSRVPGKSTQTFLEWRGPGGCSPRNARPYLGVFPKKPQLKAVSSIFGHSSQLGYVSQAMHAAQAVHSTAL
jgi:hypothetical protein